MDISHSLIRDQLNERRSKLDDLLGSTPEDRQLLRLIEEVDAAIERLEKGTYGLCEVCNDPIETERLLVDPISRFCVEHMSRDQQTALEKDLELASRIQEALLPKRNLTIPGWASTYHYEAAGPVSGDYCDLLDAGGDLYFIVGDVSGKGVAASMLMAHLHASFRALVAQGLPLEQLIGRASSMFCESSLPTHFATLVCGKATESGDVTFCNAGHHPALLIRESGIETFEATGLPIGMFCEEHYSLCETHLEPGDSLFMYTDGLLEAENDAGQEYGMDRLRGIILKSCSLEPAGMISACLDDLGAFMKGAPIGDDLTMMAIRKL